MLRIISYATLGPVFQRLVSLPAAVCGLTGGLNRLQPIPRAGKLTNPGSPYALLRSLILACLVSLVPLGIAAKPAGAAIIHTYLSKPSATISASTPGGIGEPRALGIDKGALWDAEIQRVNGYEASSGKYVSSLTGGVSSFGAGVTAGEMGGSEQVYANAAGGTAVFDGASGVLLGTWAGTHVPRGILRGVAVDDSAGATKGLVYISSASVTPGLNVVNVFNPEEALVAGEEPAKVVAVLAGTCETPGEVATGLTPCEHSTLLPFSTPAGVGAVGVSGLNGDVFVTDGDISGGGGTGVDVFEPVSGEPGAYRFVVAIAGSPGVPFAQVTAVAVDPASGEVYVADLGRDVVDQFTTGGVFRGQITGISEIEPFPQGAGKGVESVAVGDLAGRETVFVGDYDYAATEGFVDVFGPSVVVPDVAVEEAKEVTPDGAVLHGTVNPLTPETHEGAECRFVYGTTRALGQTAACSLVLPEGNSAMPVEAKVEGLAPDTTYFYRLRASNKQGVDPGLESEDREFKTSGPGLVEFASGAASTAVTLNAKIAPDGGATSYYFQYSTASTTGCTATQVFSSCASVPAPPGEAVGAAAAPQEEPVEQRVQGLQPGTLYQYRVIAVSEIKEEGGEVKTEVFPGTDQTFKTQAAASAAGLIDGRSWEQVSPVDKHGAQLQAISEGWVIQSSLSGEAFTYVGSTPTETGAKGYNGFAEQILSTRGPNGWSSQDISLPHADATGPDPGNGQDYRLFSEDLSLGVAEPLGEGPFVSLAPETFPPDTERTPYLRHNSTCTSTPATCFEPLLTGVPGYSDLPEEGINFGGVPSATSGEVQFDGASPDAKHVVLSPAVALSKATPAGTLYEFSEGAPVSQRLAPVSVLPAGEGGGVAEGYLGVNSKNTVPSLSARGAVSSDGSRVLWSGPGGLYLRDVPRAETLRIGGSLQVADSDASRVFYTNAGALNVCEVIEGAHGLECDTTDLTHAVVLGGVLGASKDGSYVYYVSNAVLGDGAQHGAQPGDCLTEGSHHEQAMLLLETCNLYVSHYDSAGGAWGAPVLVGVLSGADITDWEPIPGEQTARVSANGQWLAFMSERPLTGYDNRDAASGVPDEEVFLYHAGSGGGEGSSVCASCDPSGARPTGVEVAKLGNGNSSLVAGDNVWETSAWLAGNVPAWTPFALRRARYQSRYLSDAGRLFFNSSDALVPAVVNHGEDVFEYEPEGVGGCSGAAGAAGVVFEEQAGGAGCVGLISSGAATGESAFLDASENGDDVFFLTAEKLVPGDVDSAYDVYDAHVCSTGSPCTGGVAGSPACTNADSCRAAPTPEPEVFGAPASTTFNGPGNQAPESKPGVKPLTRAQKLNAALKLCHAKRGKKRASCEKSARKRFGLVKAKKRGKANGSRL